MSTPMANLSSAPVEGYPKLAYHMGTYGDSAIYRRFSSLNSRNLLYFQAELTHLEHKLCRLEAADAASSDGKRSKYSKDWYWLNESESSENNEQWETVCEIRCKLNDYNEALIQQSVVSRIADPTQHHIRFLQNWLERPKMGNLALIGKDNDTWGASDEPISSSMDLLAIHSDSENDPFSVWFSQKFIRFIHRVFWHRLKKSNDVESGIITYEGKMLERFTSRIATIVASSLPILTIVCLYLVGAMHVRLGLIALFTVVFATCLSFFTKATRGETFIATTTFAAVQVVFISNNNC